MAGKTCALSSGLSPPPNRRNQWGRAPKEPADRSSGTCSRYRWQAGFGALAAGLLCRIRWAATEASPHQGSGRIRSLMAGSSESIPSLSGLISPGKHAIDHRVCMHGFRCCRGRLRDTLQLISRAVGRLQVSASGRFHNVLAAPSAGKLAALKARANGHFCQTQSSLPDRVNGEIHNGAGNPRDPVDGAKGGVAWPLAGRGVMINTAVFFQLQGGGRAALVGRNALKEFQGKRLRRVGEIVGNYSNQVLVVDLLLAIGKLAKNLISTVKLRSGKLIAQIFIALRQGMAAGMFSQNEFVGRHPDGLGLHDLISDGVFQHAILVNARFMREGVAAH